MNHPSESKGEDMAKVITYECKECGCEIIVSGSHESHLRPIYCCGTEVEKVPASKRTARTKTTKKPLTKSVGKVKKTAARKPAAKKSHAKERASKK